MDAPAFQALALTGLRNRLAKEQTERLSHKDHVWSRLLDRPLSVDLEAKMNPVLHHQLQTSSYDLAALCHVLLILIRKWPTES